jgi:protein NrfC
MAACSLVHHGQVNLSLARIQVMHDHFGRFPADAVVSQCRQCVKPKCVAACPAGALSANPRQGNVRTIDGEKCTGCGECMRACPYAPVRVVWNHETRRAQKCDLCAGAVRWKQSGAPRLRQACVEVCPVGAIAFSSAVPSQAGDQGYLVNLRGRDWELVGHTTGP